MRRSPSTLSLLRGRRRPGGFDEVSQGADQDQQGDNISCYLKGCGLAQVLDLLPYNSICDCRAGAAEVAEDADVLTIQLWTEEGTCNLIVRCLQGEVSADDLCDVIQSSVARTMPQDSPRSGIATSPAASSGSFRDMQHLGSDAESMAGPAQQMEHPGSMGNNSRSKYDWAPPQPAERCLPSTASSDLPPDPSDHPALGNSSPPITPGQPARLQLAHSGNSNQTQDIELSADRARPWGSKPELPSHPGHPAPDPSQQGSHANKAAPERPNSTPIQVRVQISSLGSHTMLAGCGLINVKVCAMLSVWCADSLKMQWKRVEASPDNCQNCPTVIEQGIQALTCNCHLSGWLAWWAHTEATSRTAPLHW